MTNSLLESNFCTNAGSFIAISSPAPKKFKYHLRHRLRYLLTLFRPMTGQHIEYREGRNISSTARYASINNRLMVEQSCRDNIESIAYILVYFLKGSLLWQSLHWNTKKDKCDAIMKKKMEVSSDILCSGLPREFQYLLDEIREIFRDLIMFDWSK